MANLSFTSQGATPFAFPGASSSSTQTTTPTTNKGLKIAAPIVQALTDFGEQGTPSSRFAPPTTYRTPASNALDQAQNTPAPSTPVKRTTTNNTDGSSTIVEYHPIPTPPVTPNASAATSGPTVPTTQYSANGKSVGTQTPGMAGFEGNASTTTPAATTQPTSTFSGLLGGLGNASQTGSSANTTAQAGLLNAPNQNAVIGQKAQSIADQYGREIADVGTKGAAFEGGQLTTGTSPVAQGNAAVTAQTTAAQQQALATGEDAALQGVGYQLTGQNQGQSGLNEAGALGNTAQGLEQSGLTSAATLAQPHATAQGQTSYDPTTGTFSGGSYQNNLQTVVSAIKNGQIGYTDGVNSIAGLSPTAKADVLAALGQGFDTVASDANAATRGSNTQAAGTATTGANATGLANSIQQETELNTAATNAQALGAQVSEALKNSGLNLTNSTDANTAISNLQNRLGNAAYTQLTIAVNDARNAYGSVLQSTGATPTDAGEAANQNINANMSPKQILASIDQLTKGVSARQQSAHQQTLQYQNQLSSSGAGGSTGGGTVQTSVGAINTNW